MKDFKWKWQDTLAVAVGLLTVGFALVNYHRLPAQLPSHIGISGEFDGFQSKDSAISLFGGLGVLMPVLMQITRPLDPKKERYAKFENAYAMIRLVISLIFDFALAASVLYGLGVSLPSSRIATVVLGAAFIVIGNYMPQVKDNYFLGVKTPWTLASPEVWRRTHRLAGALWAAAGVVIIVGSFLPGSWFTVMLIAALLLAVVFPYVYSWADYRRFKA
ncbi:putative membrane protein [Paenibacillus forsythiae]|uniref:Membrane protein n=1 Tax=Paenibacillus forsythiae TaxID=365616 RepID=A0ABU3H9R6_9BACL|nr:SdpI family protein [Paenibacillus forsythiae]MDT3427569.1 putative membrane protein [Paenibacillus forsythiae]